VNFPESKRLRLREFDLTDFAALHDFVSPQDVCEYTDWGPNTVVDTEAFLREAALESVTLPRTSYTLAVERKSDDRLIGSCAVCLESETHARGAIGFVFHPEVWRQGFATEVVTLLIGLGRERLGCERIEATCRPDNVGSRKGLERAGFALEGLLRRHVNIKGQRQDSLVLSVLSG
jgi:ribosomal-protein-alanine N-acetyltransferase